MGRARPAGEEGGGARCPPGPRTLVLGLGNPTLGDDGVGWHVVDALALRLESRPGVTLERSCRGGIALMEELAGFDRAVVVDAIVTGAPPGTIHRLRSDALPTQHSACGHDVNLPTALALGRRAGVALPPRERLRIVGVEAAEVRAFGETCSPDVSAAVPRAARAVLEILESWEA